MDKILKFALLEEEEEDNELLYLLLRYREPTSDLFRTRSEEGYYNLLINGYLRNNEKKFREFLRVNNEQFEFILNLVQEDLRVTGSNAVKNPITPGEKLALTLRFLATGESFRSLAFGFRISHNYISVIIRNILRVLREKLVPIFIPQPTKERLRQSALEFWNKCSFPNCVGAVDGKHIRIFCPNKSGSLFFNYKNFFSIVLLALVDANNKFIVINVGSYGKEGDSGIFAKSQMGKLIFSGEFFPEENKLPNSSLTMPHVIIGDEAFRLHKHIMKPYSKISAKGDKEKTIFNYRLSHARRVSENAFGLLCQVFRIFYSPIAVTPDTCDDIVTVACCLHNMLRDAYLENKDKPFYEYDPNIDGPSNVSSLKRTGADSG